MGKSLSQKETELKQTLKRLGVDVTRPPNLDEPHPSAETLVDYVDGKLDDESARHVRVHILYCDECFKEVAALEELATAKRAKHYPPDVNARRSSPRTHKDLLSRLTSTLVRMMKTTPLEGGLTREEGLRILMRDNFTCQYCGLDGATNFDNSLTLTVDFVVPRALKGKKEPSNLVTACRSCNVLKGRHRFQSFEDAKQYVLQRREKERDNWQALVAERRRRTA